MEGVLILPALERGLRIVIRIVIRKQSQAVASAPHGSHFLYEVPPSCPCLSLLSRSHDHQLPIYWANIALSLGPPCPFLGPPCPQ